MNQADFQDQQRNVIRNQRQHDLATKTNAKPFEALEKAKPFVIGEGLRGAVVRVWQKPA